MELLQGSPNKPRGAAGAPQCPLLDSHPGFAGGHEEVGEEKLDSIHLELAGCVWDGDRCCLDRLGRWVARQGDHGCTVYRRLPA